MDRQSGLSLRTIHPRSPLVGVFTISARLSAGCTFSKFLFRKTFSHIQVRPPNFSCLYFLQGYFEDPPYLPPPSNLTAVENQLEGYVYFVSNFETLKCVNNSWMGLVKFLDLFKNFNVSHDDSHRYLLSFYYSSEILVGVGYGDLFGERVRR